MWQSLMVMGAALWAAQAQAFCGFYVGKADSSLWNEASQVILSRDGPRTVISMLNDYKGELSEFALVVPVPTVLERSQINIGEALIFDRMDAYSAPRLAEYFDADPCRPRVAMAAAPSMAMRSQAEMSKALGVTVEAAYTVGEYDIVMLSATQSDGLETWLKQNGYRLPEGASRALAPYIKQGMKFFVAKVNLKEQAKTGFTKLRPLQFAFESNRFMLPMRLGMLNADANKPQDLIVYVLTRNGRVESSNYRTLKLPANMDLPVHVRPDFKNFYRAMFEEQAKRESYKVVWTEYFWDMSWCDPCAANPLSGDELRKAGVHWLTPAAEVPSATAAGVLPRRGGPMPAPAGAQPVMLTRLHLRYTSDSFPEDLMLTETKDRENYQTRYVIRHPWKAKDQEKSECEAGKNYLQELIRRQEEEAKQLATLTGWDINEIRSKMKLPGAVNGTGNPPKPLKNWWENLWGRR
ncbi:MAG: hypothetical protein RLZZ502_638 [Pseudomonadota bacterium]|jgi:hypothetical protein